MHHQILNNAVPLPVLEGSPEDVVEGNLEVPIVAHYGHLDGLAPLDGAQGLNLVYIILFIYSFFNFYPHKRSPTSLWIY